MYLHYALIDRLTNQIERVTHQRKKKKVSQRNQAMQMTTDDQSNESC